MNTRLPILAVLALLTFNAPAKAQSGKFGIGLRFGSPTTLTLKSYFSERNALDINIGAGPYGIYDNNYGRYRGLGFSAMVNYLWRQNVGGAPGLELYYGVGGLVSARSYYHNNDTEYRTNLGLGVTGALGLEYFIPKAPISVFVELNPYVEVFPAPLWINLLGGIGGRFVF